MGTRSMTYFVNSDGDLLFAQYSQHDGFLDSHGMDICNIFTGADPSIPDDYKDTKSNVAGFEYPILKNNGIECVALSYLKFKKKAAYNDYLLKVPTVPGSMFDASQNNRLQFLNILHDYSRKCGAEYDYVLYFDETNKQYNMLCTDLCFDPSESDSDTPVLYDGPIHKLPQFIEEQKVRKEEEKRKAEEAKNAPPAQPDASASPLAAALADGEFADIEFIAMPEYD